jgi:hypothetical protein
MEKLFYVAEVGDSCSGIFGSLFECAQYILRMERVPGEVVASPDEEDPLESLNEILGYSTEIKYELVDATQALTRFLTLEEVTNLKTFSELKLKTSEAWDFIEHHELENTDLAEIAGVLHARTVEVRARGVTNTYPNSPFTDEQFEQLIQQLS